LASNHYISKRNRRPKNKRRKDYTRETMLKLRELRQTLPLTVADLRKVCDILRKSSIPAINGMYTYRFVQGDSNGETRS
jgi:hypothetical protein